MHKRSRCLEVYQIDVEETTLPLTLFITFHCMWQFPVLEDVKGYNTLPLEVAVHRGIVWFREYQKS